MLIKEKLVFIIIMIKIKEDHQIFNIVMFIVRGKNVKINFVNLHIINFNSFIIQIDIRRNFVNFLQIILKNVNIKVSAHLLTHKIKLHKI